MENMKSYFEIPEGRIYHGNALDVLRSIGSESVQMCVTSPPYWGLRDYGLPPMVWDDPCEPSESLGVTSLCEHEWGDELTNRNRGSCGNKSTLDGGSMVENIESKQGQFCQLCNAWRGCLGLEPTPELYIKHMVEIFRELRRVLRNDGTLWLNMGDSYAGSGSPGGDFRDGKGGDKYLRPYNRKGDGLKPKDLCGIPWMLAFALRADGWYLRSDIIWHKPNPMPESVTDRPTKAHEYLFLLTKSAKYFYDNEAVKEDRQGNTHSRGTKKTPPIEAAGIGHKDWCKYMTNDDDLTSRNKRTVWTIPTQPMPQAHFATFPEALIEPCILAGTSERGCCVECGAGWIRIIEKTDPERRNVKSDYPHKQTIATSKYKHGSDGPGSKTIGWKPSCGCYGTEPLPDIPKQFKMKPKVHPQGWTPDGFNDEPSPSDEPDEDYAIRIAPILQERKNLLDSWKPLKTIPCTVLDPFAGSCTTALVAAKHGRKFVMIELSKEYIDEIGIPRIKKATKQLKLW